MVHPLTELRHVSADIGRGVFATAAIPRGTLLWVVCDRERFYSPAQTGALSAAEREAIERHGYIDAGGEYVLCCDLGAYVNHSCRPTTLPIGAEAEIAVRDVAAGDQITCDYSMLNLTSALRCHCGLPGCRGVVRGADVLRDEYWPAWDRLVREAVQRAAGVPQPLLRFARARGYLEAIIAGVAPIPTVRTCFNQEAEAPEEPSMASPLWRLPTPS